MSFLRLLLFVATTPWLGFPFLVVRHYDSVAQLTLLSELDNCLSEKPASSAENCKKHYVVGLFKPALRMSCPAADPALYQALVILQELNSYNVDRVDLVECPEQYPGCIDNGEANGWIGSRQERLKTLGFSAKWNRGRKQYELYSHSGSK
jgi:hypothetical protein